MDIEGRSVAVPDVPPDRPLTRREAVEWSGWYPGRAVHLHFLIRSGQASRRAEFTSQLYFDDRATDRVHLLAPYAKRGPRKVRNDGDGLYRQGGAQLTLAVAEHQRGLIATFAVRLQDE